MAKPTSNLAKEAQGRAMIAISQKIVLSLVLVPLALLLSIDSSEFMQLNWVTAYTLVGVTLGAFAYKSLSSGLRILDEVGKSEEE